MLSSIKIWFFFCAGDSGNGKTCMTIDLSSLNNPLAKRIKDMNVDHNIQSSLISTPSNIYILSGKGVRNSCEFYDSLKDEWIPASNLNRDITDCGYFCNGSLW